VDAHECFEKVRIGKSFSIRVDISDSDGFLECGSYFRLIGFFNPFQD